MVVRATSLGSYSFNLMEPFICPVCEFSITVSLMVVRATSFSFFATPFGTPICILPSGLTLPIKFSFLVVFKTSNSGAIIAFAIELKLVKGFFDSEHERSLGSFAIVLRP